MRRRPSDPGIALHQMIAHARATGGPAGTAAARSPAGGPSASRPEIRHTLASPGHSRPTGRPSGLGVDRTQTGTEDGGGPQDAGLAKGRWTLVRPMDPSQPASARQYTYV